MQIFNSLADLQTAIAEDMIAWLRQEQRELEEGGALASVFDVFLKHRNVQALDRALLFSRGSVK